MRCLRAILAALCLAALPAQLSAAPSYATNLGPSDTGISGTALNTNPTLTLRTDGTATLTLYVQLTRVAATSVTINCTAGPATTVQAPLGVATVASAGTISMAAASWTYPVSGNTTVRVIISPVNDVFTVCTFGGASAGASDLVSVYARLVSN
jgi:hypothetical protein